MSFNAFELVPVIDRLQLMGDKPKTTIQCLDCAAQNLFIGTADCFLIHYIVADDESPSGKAVFQYSLQGYKQLGLRKPIQQLITAASINRLIVLCDGVLLMLSMFGLELLISGFKDKLKGATCIARNDNPTTFDPFSVEVCVGTKKKAIIIVTITEDNVYPTREISLSELPLQLKFDGNTVCVALSNMYCNLHVPTGKVQELISYEAHNTRPMIARIAVEEFLLSGPTDVLGMFVTSGGTSLRPPLSWTDGLVTLGYSFPYVVVVGRSTITVYSILESDKNSQKQVIPFQGGRITCNVENKVFICSPRAVFCLVQVPFKRQIQMLMNAKKVEEAVALAKVAMQTEIGSSKDEQLLVRVQQQAGFVYLSEGKYEKASEMMQLGNLDVRELIALFPGFLPARSQFKSQIPGMEHLKDITHLAQDDTEIINNSKQFLQEYLEQCKGQDNIYYRCKEEIDSALLKLYAEQNSPILSDLVCTKNACAYEDTVDWLKKCKRYHSLALFYESRNELAQALDIWKRLVDGDLKDTNYPGIECVIKCLINLNDEDLIWRYVPWLMEKDQALAVRIFSERPSTDKGEKLQPDYILEYFSKIPIALQKYLEFLVFQEKLEKEKYHSRLAILYLDEVQNLSKNPGSSKEMLKEARSSLQALLKFSSLYNASLLLSKIPEDSGLDLETAMLYGRLEHHEKALRIYVIELKDFDGAVAHCEFYSKGRDTDCRKRLFYSLLSVYLQPGGKQTDAMVMAAVALLNSHVQDFDPVKVIEIIPQEWSIRLISPFLTGLSRQSLHLNRNTKIRKNLVRAENVKAKKGFINQTAKPVLITEETHCRVCHRPFNDGNIARYPNNVIAHIHCARNKTLCPVTGQLFSVFDKEKQK